MLNNSLVLHVKQLFSSRTMQADCWELFDDRIRMCALQMNYLTNASFDSWVTLLLESQMSHTVIEKWVTLSL